MMTGQELKALRHQMGLTQKELAEKIGVPWNTVARWEVGMRKIAEPIARLVHYIAKEVKAEKKPTKKR
jgi:DNA-binding transcriptional regulator YiaG